MPEKKEVKGVIERISGSLVVAGGMEGNSDSSAKYWRLTATRHRFRSTKRPAALCPENL